MPYLLRCAAGLPLADMVDAELLQLPLLLEHASLAAAAGTVPEPADTAAAVRPPQRVGGASQQRMAASHVDSGMLNLAEFGMAEPAQQQQQQQQQGGDVHSGMLDLAAFGMAPPEPAASQQQVQQPPGGDMHSGMLDLAAFGMAPAEPTAAAPPTLDGMPQAASRPAPAAPPRAGPSPARQPAAKPLPAPRQPTLPIDQLLPVAADCWQQLRALLLPPPPEDDEGALVSGSGPPGMALQPPVGSSASLPHMLQGGGTATPASAAAIPGLTLEETAAVLSIADAFCAAATPAAGGSEGPRSSGSPAVDTAAAHFVTAVSLACATGGGDPHASRHTRQAAQLPQQRVTVMNAAGVAYTLAPSAVAGGGNGGGDGGSCVGQQWGLMPGLDATSLVWALLSGGWSVQWGRWLFMLRVCFHVCAVELGGRMANAAVLLLGPSVNMFLRLVQPTPLRCAGTEDEMLRQALRRLQTHEAAASAAAAAAECQDAAAFLAMRTAAKGEPGAPPRLCPAALLRLLRARLPGGTPLLHPTPCHVARVPHCSSIKPPAPTRCPVPPRRRGRRRQLGAAAAAGGRLLAAGRRQPGGHSGAAGQAAVCGEAQRRRLCAAVQRPGQAVGAAGAGISGVGALGCWWHLAARRNAAADALLCSTLGKRSVLEVGQITGIKLGLPAPVRVRCLATEEQLGSL